MLHPVQRLKAREQRARLITRHLRVHAHRFQGQAVLTYTHIEELDPEMGAG